MPDELSLLERLVAIPSVSGEEVAIAAFVEETARGWGLDVVRDDTSVRVEVRGRGPGPTLALVSHLDVVPPGAGWTRDPFTPAVEGDRLYGRGSGDAKASVAATETEAPHVSNREDCFTLRFGHDNADYLLVSINEAKLGATRKHFTQAVSSGQYGFLRQSGGFMLWKRGAPQDKNAAGLKLIGPEPPPARRKK